MNKLNTILLAGMLLLIFSSQSYGQQLIQKEFPQRPPRQIFTPPDTLVQAWHAFDSRMPTWQIRWDKETGTPGSMMGDPIRGSGRNPREIATNFLKMNKAIFSVDSGIYELRFKKITGTENTTHVIFSQYYDGIHIEGGSYAVHMNDFWEIYLVNGKYYSNVKIDGVLPSLSLSSAIDVASRDLHYQVEFRGEPIGVLVILPYGDEYILSWKVTLPTNIPFGEWTYYISSKDGSILSGYNSMDFMVDDISTTDSGNSALLINEKVPINSETANIEAIIGIVYDRHPDAGDRVFRNLTNLDPPGYYLDGDHVIVTNEDDDEAYEEDLTYYYNDESTNFDEVMAYYHIDLYMDNYMNSLGYLYLNYPNTQVQIKAEVHSGYNWPQAVIIGADSMRFGDGNGVTTNDTAKESTVFYHETQHLVTEYLTYDGLDGDLLQERAMDEAFSDYHSLSFVDIDTVTIVGEWVIIIGQRDVENTYDMSDWTEVGPLDHTSYHAGSQIFSGALWDMRQEFGQSVADEIIFEGLQNLTQEEPDFLDGREALIAYDLAENSGSHIDDIVGIFGDREIGSVPSTPTITYALPEEHGAYDAVHLKWTRNDDDDYVIRYKVERSTDGGAYQHLWYITQTESGSLVEEWDDLKFGWGEVECYTYKVKAENGAGWGNWSPAVPVYNPDPPESPPSPDEVTSIQLPEKFTLEQNYPNPFNPSTQIKFGLPKSSHVRLRVMNIRGETVRVLVDDEMGAGWHTVNWDGKNEGGRQVATGIYLYLIEADGKRILKRMTLMK